MKCVITLVAAISFLATSFSARAQISEVIEELNLAELSSKSSAKKEGPKDNCVSPDGKPTCGDDADEPLYDKYIKDKSMDEYFEAINMGWPKSYAQIRDSLKPGADYLVIHSQEPNDVFDARSANNFKKGLLAKGIKKLANSTMGIGH